MDESFLINSTEAEPTQSQQSTSGTPDGSSSTPTPTEARDDIRSDIREIIAEQTRDEKGRFAAKSGEAPAPTEVPATPEASAESAPENPVTPQEPAEFPQSWSAQDREVFKALPEPARNTILRREKELLADYTRKTGQAAQIMRRYAPIESVIAPHEESWRLSGHTPEQVLGQLVSAQKRLDSNPIEGISIIMQSYGVTPQDLIDQVGAGSAQNLPELHSVKEELRQLRETLSQRQQYEAQSQQQSRIEQVANFANEKDAQGNLLRPHFESVSPIVERLVGPLAKQQPGVPLPTILQQAYDQAVWANPQTRESLLQKERETKQQTQIEEQKRKAEQAKKAGVSINGTPGGGNTNGAAAPTGSVRDTILWAYNLHNN